MDAPSKTRQTAVMPWSQRATCRTERTSRRYSWGRNPEPCSGVRKCPDGQVRSERQPAPGHEAGSHAWHCAAGHCDVRGSESCARSGGIPRHRGDGPTSRRDHPHHGINPWRHGMGPSVTPCAGFHGPQSIWRDRSWPRCCGNSIRRLSAHGSADGPAMDSSRVPFEASGTAGEFTEKTGWRVRRAVRASAPRCGTSASCWASSTEGGRTGACSSRELPRS